MATDRKTSIEKFREYFMEKSKLFGYRIKTVHEITPDMIETIKRVLYPYGVEYDKPKRLMAQHNPLDFPKFPMSEIWYIDIETKVPASSYVMMTQLVSALGIMEGEIRVRGVNEPMELQGEIEQPNTKLNDPFYQMELEPNEVPFGDEYNKKLMNYLATERQEAKKNPKLFSYLDNYINNVEVPTKTSEDFNKDFDTVKPVSKPRKKTDKPNNTSALDIYLGE
jgi:hypothetical protein